MRKTKIVCTVGPATDNDDILREMMPVVAQVKTLLDGRAAVYQLDIDQNQQTAEEAGANSIPTFILYRDGKEVWRHSGEIDGEVLLSKVESAL